MNRKEYKLLVENWRSLLSGKVINESIDDAVNIGEKSKILYNEFADYYASYLRHYTGDGKDVDKFINDPDIASDVFNDETGYSKNFQKIYDEMINPESSEDKDEILSLRDLLFKACVENDKDILLGNVSNVDKKFSGDRSRIITNSTRFYTYSYNQLDDTPLQHLFISDPRTMQLDNNNTFKPSGIWFGKEDEWKRFCEENNFNMDDEYRYKSKLTLNLKRMVILDSHEIREDFEAEYLQGSGRMASIDWGKVSDDYDGVIIDENAMIPTGHWTSMWDITSGCVWRASGIIRIDDVEFDLENNSNYDEDYY